MPLPAALMLASQGMQTLGNLYSGFAKAEALDFSADISRRNAEQVKLDTAELEARFRRQSAKRRGSRRANIGASGITLDGSAYDVMLDSAVEEELQALTIKHSGDVEAMNQLLNAQLDEQKARNTRVASVLGAVSGSASAAGNAKAAGLF